MAGNRWARLDTGYLRNPKVRTVGAAGAMLHLASILHCVDQLTDGQIDDSSLTSLASDAGVGDRWRRRRAGELVDAGLWIPTESGWRLHDFERMNPQAMRKVVEHERELWRERQRRLRAGEHGDVTP
jgi:hypothetical protein